MAVTHVLLLSGTKIQYEKIPTMSLIRLISELEPTATGIFVITFLNAITIRKGRRNKKAVSGAFALALSSVRQLSHLRPELLLCGFFTLAPHRLDVIERPFSSPWQSLFSPRREDPAMRARPTSC